MKISEEAVQKVRDYMRKYISPIGPCMMACSASALVRRQVAVMSAYANMTTSYKAYRKKVIDKLYKNRRGFWKRKRRRRYVIHG